MNSLKKYTVRIGYPARQRSVVVEAANPDTAVQVAVNSLIAAGEDREWLEKYAANRHPRTGTCYVEQR